MRNKCFTGKRQIVVLLYVLCALTALAQRKVNVDRLDRLFAELAARTDAVIDSCRYTGSSFKGHRGFEWQRGTGSGWTTGLRITIGEADTAEEARIRSVFSSYEGTLPQVNLGENRASTFEEGTKTFYGYRYLADEKKLCFLKASTPGEICIPADWPVRSFLDASVKEPLPQNAGKREERLLGLSRLWAGIRQNFVFMNRVPFNWDSLYVSMIPQVAEAKNDDEYVRLLQKMAASVRDGHTYVWGSSTVSPMLAPVTTRLIEGRVYVDEVLSSELKQKGMKRGMEVVKVNGRDVKEYGRTEIAPYTSASTPQWLAHRTYEDHNLIQGKGGTLIELELRDGKKSFSLTYENGSAEWDLKQKKETIAFTLLPGDIGLLTIRDFMNPQIRENFDKLYPAILQTKALVIDVRNNEGGNSGNAEYIVRHLSKDSISQDTWESPMYVPALVSWNYPPQWYRSQPRKMAPFNDKPLYDKPMVLLVNSGTFSAAEDFCGLFKGMKRWVMIGTPTGGSTGNGVRIELVAGCAWANICSKHDTAPDGTEFVGHGFKPDIEVTETYRSYFKDKRDACISEALRYLETALKRP